MLQRRNGVIVITTFAFALFLWALTGCPTKRTPEGWSVMPQSLDFGAATRSDTLIISHGGNGGEGEFQVHGEAPWLSVTPKSGTLQPQGGPTIIAITVTRAFMKPGGNSATLRVTLPGSDEVEVPVRADAILSADFTATPAEVLEGDPVLFNDTSRVLTGADPVTEWHWAFGDGASSTERNPVHVYAAKGRYPVTLTIQSRGLTDTRTRAACVIVKRPAAPKAQFAVSTRAPIAGHPVQFVDVSLPGTSPIAQWSWDFGDGAFSALRDPIHIYTAAAVYDVLLTVTTDEGSDTEMKLGLMDVRPAPPIASSDPQNSS
ncbi:MAG: PKD domain-containing protein [Candidatus Hydrogenedentes bacterium]|nr:PKD domain-containing protein [Candidatus Hydrogenedentota bacterium]